MKKEAVMYASNPEWGPASHNPENPHSYEATQVALDIRAEHGERPDDN